MNTIKEKNMAVELWNIAMGIRKDLLFFNKDELDLHIEYTSSGNSVMVILQNIDQLIEYKKNYYLEIFSLSYVEGRDYQKRHISKLLSEFNEVARAIHERRLQDEEI